MTDPRIGTRIECLNPLCGYAFDAASGLEDEDARPQDGDVSLCMSCAHLALFTADEDGNIAGIRPIDAKTRAEVMEDPATVQAMYWIIAHRDETRR